MSNLRKNELCMLHKRRDCCGRAESVRYKKPQNRSINGVTKYPDGREKCSLAVLRARKNILLNRPHPVCAACGEEFTDYRDVELAHKESKGLGGSKHDDRWPNLCLMHKSENREQGSRSLADYLAWRIEKGLPVGVSG
jgi:hypothetical protein